MLTATAIRHKFLEFFRSKGHVVVPSAPIVVKNDPTLMFTNAGMNPFKDIFLGAVPATDPRVADTQKCLRVSGKHNDLEEVGVDTYHHTMFEMLGNWSFGDYFKSESIDWAWELLTGEYGIDPDRIYVTVFEGDVDDGLQADEESAGLWKKWVAPDRVLYFGKKDNFWEMGDTGPCGPCSEIHVDMRDAEARQRTDGRDLVNRDHPEVIEIWNLVFIQYNRNRDGLLSPLPQRHVDTGMGFERLCMVLQDKRSSYDTDVFSGLISRVSELTGTAYGTDPQSDIAIRVVVDHIRAIAFAIADGQLPSNTGAGYVIRRILRRAVRYYYNFLGRKEAMLHLLVERLAVQFGGVFPEVSAQREFIARVVEEEERSFLRTLESGLARLDALMEKCGDSLPGEEVFELYDTYGFPADLTRLLAAERGRSIDEAGFERALNAQRERSRQAAAAESGDWTVLAAGTEVTFTGHDSLEEVSPLLRYRTVKDKKKTYTQVVLSTTPFYAESGGQQGDKGFLEQGGRRFRVFDTKKENDLIIHYVEGTPGLTGEPVRAVVDAENRRLSCQNHSATHLLHAALKRVLGSHVEQRGSSLNADHLRFDFSHFSKVTDEELARVEDLVNERIFADIALDERRRVPKEEALAMGANALFGEKYGDEVRVIIFDPEYSIELCGGTHVPRTSSIGLFKIVQETAVAAGVRRIEAVTGKKALDLLNERSATLRDLGEMLKQPADIRKALGQLLEEQTSLRRQVEAYEQAAWNKAKDNLKEQARELGDARLIVARVPGLSAEGIKKIAFDLKRELDPVIALIGSEHGGKPVLGLVISESLTGESLHAGKLIRQLAAHIGGGGGGQPFFATAGGQDASGLDAALEAGKTLFEKSLNAIAS